MTLWCLPTTHSVIQCCHMGWKGSPKPWASSKLQLEFTHGLFSSFPWPTVVRVGIKDWHAYTVPVQTEQVDS